MTNAQIIFFQINFNFEKHNSNCNYSYPHGQCYNKLWSLTTFDTTYNNKRIGNLKLYI